MKRETNLLYNTDNEHDACGVGLIANLYGSKSHGLIEDALQVLEHMVHRGAEGADSKTGDGAGIMVQVPHEFILLQGIAVPEKGKYGTGLIFLPKDDRERDIMLDIIKTTIAEDSMTLLHIRDVPVDSSVLGEAAKSVEPDIKQLFVSEAVLSDIPLELRLYILRKHIEQKVLNSKLLRKDDFYIVSLSSKNLVYKGMLSSDQLRFYFPDLVNPNFTSGIALVHSRFSTNTFPTWSLAQPFRLLGHNGEINTIRGNRRWMEARSCVLQPRQFTMEEISPILQPHMSDSASLDNVLEFFVMAGMELPHALAMMIPESFNRKNSISHDLKAFYEYHSILMEAWDGPATLLFSDGRYAGGMLDRNGLRPARYLVTNNDTLIIASEMGVLPFDAKEIKEKGRLHPGKMLMVDTQQGKIYQDKELKDKMAREYPYAEWLFKNRIHLEEIRSGRVVQHSCDNMWQRLRAFGYQKEDIDRILIPMSKDTKEPIASMGNDTPLAVFSDRPQLIFNYFRQQFAQVTNPPIDPIREELVMSLESYIGALNKNLLQLVPEHCKMVKMNNPILTNRDLDILRNLKYKGFRTLSIDLTLPVTNDYHDMEKAIESICRQAAEAVDNDINYIILSDRKIDESRIAIPSLLAVSAVHNYLIEKHKRVQTALVVEAGDVREVMHFALLLGYGASAVNPYLAMAVIDNLITTKELQLDFKTAEHNYITAVNKGLLKIISKMGISTLGSYKGAQLFDAVGVSNDFLSKYFCGTTSAIEGVGMEEIWRDVMRFHTQAFDGDSIDSLPNEGLLSFKKDGEYHAWNPQTIARLQTSTRLGDYAKFKEFTSLVDDKTQYVFVHDLLDFKRGTAIDINEVEPVESIVKRFVAGAMSFGAISKEAHETIALAMNRLGGRSNTGEGGEDAERFKTRADGTSVRSAIKQVASGRFGVTTAYLVNADEIQIKVAQGAKPGEGGQLPGFKVDEVIAKTRHSIPGISLISPPPHHDIYSIEDLAQLIYDLKTVNPNARVSVKLVSEKGIGTIAAGVAKAKADLVVISGAEGGTGASPLSSIRYAGLPAEIGLAETQQTLVLNNLRGQVTLQVDGQLKTGRDVMIQALLGAEEFGFATSVLIVLGCVMKRECHMNTCPMGVATQNEELRKRFRGHADYLVNYFSFLAQEIREYLAAMGYRKMDDIIGRADLLYRKNIKSDNTKLNKVNLSKLISVPEVAKINAIRHGEVANKRLEGRLNEQILKASKPALDLRQPVELSYRINNTDRAVGTLLSGRIVECYGEAGLNDGTVTCNFKGSAGQSFGAFLANGVTLRLNGDANDYVGKGLSGGQIIIKPTEGVDFLPEENVIAGNTILYGATSGRVYINGCVGERFCVRNSGAVAVVEGVGDHCCEYMTGGCTVVLGKTGRNFAAGMSGGTAYVWNKDGDFDYYCNMEMIEISLIEDEADNSELHKLVMEHYIYTNSPLAKRMLDNWQEYQQQFVKVMPIEYKRILQEKKRNDKVD